MAHSAFTSGGPARAGCLPRGFPATCKAIQFSNWVHPRLYGHGIVLVMGKSVSVPAAAIIPQSGSRKSSPTKSNQAESPSPEQALSPSGWKPTSETDFQHTSIAPGAIFALLFSGFVPRALWGSIASGVLPSDRLETALRRGDFGRILSLSLTCCQAEKYQPEKLPYSSRRSA